MVQPVIAPRLTSVLGHTRSPVSQSRVVMLPLRVAQIHQRPHDMATRRGCRKKQILSATVGFETAMVVFISCGRIEPLPLAVSGFRVPCGSHEPSQIDGLQFFLNLFESMVFCRRTKPLRIGGPQFAVAAKVRVCTFVKRRPCRPCCQGNCLCTKQ